MTASAFDRFALIGDNVAAGHTSGGAFSFDSRLSELSAADFVEGANAAVRDVIERNSQVLQALAMVAEMCGASEKDIEIISMIPVVAAAVVTLVTAARALSDSFDTEFDSSDVFGLGLAFLLTNNTKFRRMFEGEDILAYAE